MRVHLGRALFRLLATFATVGVALVLGAGSATANDAMIRVGAAARLPLFTAVLGRVEPTRTFRLSVALEPRNPQALAQLATEVSTPGSPDYGRFLTVKQFARRFGAPPAAVAAVRAVLARDGLSVGPATANNLMIPVRATASAIDDAMSAQLSRVELPDGRRAYANLDAPAFAPSIARYIQGVIGLDDINPAEPAGLVVNPRRSANTVLAGARTAHTVVRAIEHAHVLTGGPQPCDTIPSTVTNSGQFPGTYTFDQLAAAYNFSSMYQAGDEGQGQTVAVLEEGGYNPTDIATFQACYGTTATVNPINVSGGPGPFNPSTDDDGEEALDIETVIALAPKATVDVYQGPDTAGIAATILNQIVTQDTAKVISSSWGTCESATGGSVISSENASLMEAALQGQSFLSSSGDSGAETCSQRGEDNPGYTTGLSVEDPSGQPYATGVGGTSLFTVESTSPAMIELDTTGALPSEVVWNEGTNDKCACLDPLEDGGASGGGISTQFPMPSYQSSAASSLGVVNPNSSGAPCGSSECREVPDVAADADGYTGYAVFVTTGGAGEWVGVGGTSAAAPLWAALFALTNADSACRGLPIGWANPSLYSIAGSSYLSNFHQITQVDGLGLPDNDEFDNTEAIGDGLDAQDPNHLYPETTGYDMDTGLGTPIANALAASLCSARAPVYSVSVTSPGNQTSVTGKAVSLQVTAADSGAATNLSYSATGLPAGLTMSGGGLITGTPTTAGTSTVTVNVSDQFTNAGSVQFSWTVVTPGPPQASTGLGGLKNDKVKLALNVGAGSNAPDIATVKISLPKGLSFARKAKLLKKGIKVTAAGVKVAFTTTGGGGSLTLHLATPEQLIAIRVTSSAINESKSLEKKIKKHKTKKVVVAIVVTDASGLATTLSATIKV